MSTLTWRFSFSLLTGGEAKTPRTLLNSFTLMPRVYGISTFSRLTVLKCSIRGLPFGWTEPEAFVLQKILASQKRKDPFKEEKDLSAAQSIGELCLQDKKRRLRLGLIYKSIPVKWQKKT